MKETNKEKKDFTVTPEMQKIIDEILKRGNDAQIRRKGNGVIILEEKKTIKYTSTE